MNGVKNSAKKFVELINPITGYAKYILFTISNLEVPDTPGFRSNYIWKDSAIEPTRVHILHTWDILLIDFSGIGIFVKLYMLTILMNEY